MKNIEEMRHEVIEWAIILENYLDEEITTFFGLSSWDASYHLQIDRERDIFVESFLRYMPLNRKFAVIEKMIESIGEELYNGFGSDKTKFMEIRNTFAHTLYPEIEEDFMSTDMIGHAKFQQEQWETMYYEAKALYVKLIKEIDSKFYTEEPRISKHKKFDQKYLLEVIQSYEKTIKELKEKSKS